MVNKIKASRARARASRPAKEKEEDQGTVPGTDHIDRADKKVTEDTPAPTDRPEWMRKASRMEGTSSFPGEDGDFAKTPTVCPTCKGYRARRKIPD